ncbi:hypothetical protein [Vibrio sp. zbq_2]|uniref:hypothetical protein n=1 Tax=Vibrio sp. zbq_2 TaxID=3367238 RepID=UPI00370ACD5D
MSSEHFAQLASNHEWLTPWLRFEENYQQIGYNLHLDATQYVAQAIILAIKDSISAL